jgi:hypothetical protein
MHVSPTQVSFSGPYPLDGAKVVEAALTRHLGRHLRKAAAAPGCTHNRHGCTVAMSVLTDGQLKFSIRNNTAADRQRQQQQWQQQQQVGHTAAGGVAEL